MENNPQQFQKRKGSRMWNGLILLIAGVLLLADKMGAPIPHWIFTWPMILILFGFISGLKSQFHNKGALIMIVIGLIFLVDESMPEMQFHNYLLPAILIGVGLIFILRPRSSWGNRQSRWSYRNDQSNYPGQNQSTPGSYTNTTNPGDNSEVLDINAVFGGVKKNILSKDFRGGEINAFMGGTEINLLQADIQHPVILEINNVFGGSKLIVPSNWEVKNEVTTIFGGIDDKRNLGTSIQHPDKVLLIKGTCIFGGIEVTNF